MNNKFDVRAMNCGNALLTYQQYIPN